MFLRYHTRTIYFSRNIIQQVNIYIFSYNIHIKTIETLEIIGKDSKYNSTLKICFFYIQSFPEIL